jgi:hypothetical protein
VEREPVQEPGDGVTVVEGVNDPLPPADQIDPDEDAQTDE